MAAFLNSIGHFPHYIHVRIAEFRVEDQDFCWKTRLHQEKNKNQEFLEKYCCKRKEKMKFTIRIGPRQEFIKFGESRGTKKELF